MVAVRGDLTFTADKVEMRTSTDGKQIESVLATGTVRIKKGEIVASGGKAIYNVTDSMIEVTEQPKVWRGRDAVGGDRIEFYIDDGRIMVDNARAILFPDDQKSNELQ